MKETRILFVDDDPHILSSFEKASRKEPFMIITTTDPHAVMDMVKLHEVDVVIADEHMPGLKGVELLKQIKDAYPDVVRCMITGDEDFATTVRALGEAKVHRFFTKPISSDRLLGEIKKYLDKQLEKAIEAQARGKPLPEKAESGGVVIPKSSTHTIPK